MNILRQGTPVASLKPQVIVTIILSAAGNGSYRNNEWKNTDTAA